MKNSLVGQVIKIIHINIISNKNPLFFLAENVSGILQSKHKPALDNIINSFKKAGTYGYNLSVGLLNSRDYGIPQDRKRVFLLGIEKT